jgi:hypothetical protein
MSTAPPSIPVTTQAARPDEVRVFQHSSLFYWWPVWAIAFILFLVTLWDGNYAAFVPAEAEARRNWRVEMAENKYETREGLILPPGKYLPPDQPETPGGPLPKPEGGIVHMARSKNLGVIFSIALLLTILISNVSVRGVWSIVVVVTVILLVVLFALFDWWGKIAEWFYLLRIYINAGGYLFIATVLFIIWAVNFYIFDRRTYVIFTPGQVRVRESVGQGEQVYDTVNMEFHKQQNDFFKHWIWGLGAGDLEVVTAKGKRFELHNVAFVGHKVRKIEELIKTREVV